MLPHIRYHIPSQFSRFPGGRRKEHGRHSGEEFREQVVIPLLSEYERITFDLGGSAGYSSGFLDEAFGELGTKFPLDELRRRLEIVADDDPDAVLTAWARIEDASRESKGRRA